MLEGMTEILRFRGSPSVDLEGGSGAGGNARKIAEIQARSCNMGHQVLEFLGLLAPPAAASSPPSGSTSASSPQQAIVSASASSSRSK
jgi:hypothetical protein